MSAARPDLSVIVLSYNTRELTLACLRSLAAAGPGLAIEVLVIDNASTDDTVAAVRAEFPSARVISNERNLGFAAGNNVGLAAAGGAYLLLLNSDTEVAPGSLRVLVDFMKNHPEAGACGPQLLNPDGTLQPSGRNLPSVWSVFVGMTKLYRLERRNFYSVRGRDYGKVARVDELSGAALLVRREAYERTGGFDPRFFAYYEDIDWCKRLGDAGCALYYVPQAQVYHLWGGTSRNVSPLAYRATQHGLAYYFAKHHGWLGHGAIVGLLVAKELVLLARAVLRRDRTALAFHLTMLGSAWIPLRQAFE
jgi:GT2 family glycosyltransferase